MLKNKELAATEAAETPHFREFSPLKHHTKNPLKHHTIHIISTYRDM
jgi:hypothetical protein